MHHIGGYICSWLWLSPGFPLRPGFPFCPRVPGLIGVDYDCDHYNYADDEADDDDTGNTRLALLHPPPRCHSHPPVSLIVLNIMVMAMISIIHRNVPSENLLILQWWWSCWWWCRWGWWWCRRWRPWVTFPAKICHSSSHLVSCPTPFRTFRKNLHLTSWKFLKVALGHFRVFH